MVLCQNLRVFFELFSGISHHKAVGKQHDKTKRNPGHNQNNQQIGQRQFGLNAPESFGTRFLLGHSSSPSSILSVTL